MGMNKMCARCHESKDETEFGIDRKRKDGRYPYCKECRAIINRLPRYREKTREGNLRFRSKPDYYEINRKHNKKYRESEKGKANSKKYREDHNGMLTEYHSVYSKIWGKTENGKSSLKRARTKHYYKDIEASRKYQREAYHKRKQSVEYKISDAISSSIYDALKENKAGRHWETLVGYTLHDLMKHLEKQFKPGMTWKNYGNWHIDHVTPRSAFNFTKHTHLDFKRCWALKNLQPLWKCDNLKKAAFIEAPFQPCLPISVETSQPV